MGLVGSWLTAPGRRIAVVEFHRRSDAEAFMDKHYPEVSFALEHSRGPDSDPMNFGVSFNRRDEPDAPRESAREGEDWGCTSVGSSIPRGRHC